MDVLSNSDFGKCLEPTSHRGSPGSRESTHMQGVGGMGSPTRIHHLLAEVTLSILLILWQPSGQEEGSYRFWKVPQAQRCRFWLSQLSRAPQTRASEGHDSLSYNPSSPSQSSMSYFTEGSRWHMNVYHLFKSIWNIYVCVHMPRCTYGGLRTTLDVRFHLPPCLRHVLLLFAYVYTKPVGPKDSKDSVFSVSPFLMEELHWN